MTLDAGLLVIGVLGVVVVLGSRAIRHLPLSEPLAALVLGVALGPAGWGIADFGAEGIPLLHALSEVVIAISLMAVALRFPWPTYWSLRRPVAWLLTVGMIGMAATVAGLAASMLGLGLGAAVLLGGVLAPTDPVLSSSIVAGRPAETILPERIRALLSAESGFNDGLALPLVVVGSVLLEDLGPGAVLADGVVPVLVAVVVGGAIGSGAGRAFGALIEDHDIEHSAAFVFTIVLALATTGSVNGLGGDGILGVFVAGLAYNRQVGSEVYAEERAVEEGINRVLVLPVFLLLGTVLPWHAWDRMGWSAPAFAGAVVLARRLPVVIALRSRLSFGWREAIFYGWFGPMGVAALFFITSVLEEAEVAATAWPAVALVVALSTVVHGMSAAPGRARYGGT